MVRRFRYEVRASGRTDMSTGLLRTASSRHAAELVRLGWTVEHQFFWGDDEEPYEIGLRWTGDDVPPQPDDDASHWATPEGAHRLASRREMRHSHTLK